MDGRTKFRQRVTARRNWITAGSLSLLSFCLGSLITARLLSPKRVDAASDRVYELDIYHAVPGKIPALESRFRRASSLLAQHHIDVLGYWVPNDDPAFANTFIYLVAHTSRADGERNWEAFHADPAFQEFRKSENAEKLIEKVDSTYMRATDYSSLK